MNLPGHRKQQSLSARECQEQIRKLNLSESRGTNEYTDGAQPITERIEVRQQPGKEILEKANQIQIIPEDLLEQTSHVIEQAIDQPLNDEVKESASQNSQEIKDDQINTARDS